MMKKERDSQTIEAEMKKRQEILKKKHDKIRSLNAELTTAKNGKKPAATMKSFPPSKMF